MDTPAHYPTQDLSSLVAGLVESELLAKEDAAKALARNRTSDKSSQHPLEYLESLNLKDLSGDGSRSLGLEKLSRWVAEKTGLPFYVIDPLKVDVNRVTSVMSEAYAQRHGILAVEVNGEQVIVATSQPWQRGWEENLRHVNRKDIKPVIASPADIRRYTLEFYKLARSVEGANAQQDSFSGISNLEQMLEIGGIKTLEANDQHVINIVDWLLHYAFEQRASDIHIEPRRDTCHLRFRIDGILHLIYQLPPKVATAVVSRIKILGRMNVAEKRKPQDGRLKTRTPEGNETELRLSTIATAFGEKLVLRIFDPDVLVKGYKELGFSTGDEARWRSMVSRSHGIVLVTGPTGSGKTTSLYSTLKDLAKSTVNICTIEDPIELIEPAFNQMQVQHSIDLNFATGMRALLRQDPDIIMVGEIRDNETAEMAIQAALTGHLVLSTLHTHDAPTAVIRMMELGIPSYLIKATVLGVMAQRLVRILCPHCKTPRDSNKADQAFFTDSTISKAPVQVYQARGCNHCRHTGYLGRSGLYEIMPVSDAIRESLVATPEVNGLRDQALKEDMTTLRESGAAMVAQGLTTIEEVLRVTSGYSSH